MSSRSKTSPKKKAGGGQKGPRKQKSSADPQKVRNPGVQAVGVAYAKPIVIRSPKIRSTEKFTRIVHREPIGFIDRSTALFSVKHFLPLNPGMPTFKWLSTQAVGWEKYVFEKLEFEYVARCPSSTAGSLMMAIDYDAADAVPGTEDIMTNYEGCAEDSIWVRSLLAKVKCDNTVRFIRTGSLADNLDVKTYDLGNFIAATSGVDVLGSNAGKVYASYVVKMMIPQLPANFAPALGGTVLSGGVVGQSNPFGTAATLSAGSQGIDILGASRIGFRDVGQYLTALTAQGTVIPMLQNPTIFSGGGSVTDSGSISSGANAVLKSIINTTVPNTVVDWTFSGTTGYSSSHMDVARAPTGSIA